MKIEKINENQIKCTLTKADLSSRKIDLKELAYGSEKAKNLFRDMMLQAHHELGFESNGIPLVIEAIPSVDSLTLIITKAKDPEELDTRFSSFSNPQAAASTELHFSGADGILNLLKKINDAAVKGALKTSEAAKTASPDAEKSEEPAHLVEAFRFSSLDDAILASKAVPRSVSVKNSFYKYDTSDYLLILHSPKKDPENFNRICNILSEYSNCDHCCDASENYLREHGFLMIADCALQKLASI